MLKLRADAHTALKQPVVITMTDVKQLALVAVAVGGFADFLKTKSQSAYQTLEPLVTALADQIDAAIPDDYNCGNPECDACNPETAGKQVTH